MSEHFTTKRYFYLVVVHDVINPIRNRTLWTECLGIEGDRQKESVLHVTAVVCIGNQFTISQRWICASINHCLSDISSKDISYLPASAWGYRLPIVNGSAVSLCFEIRQ